MILPDSQRIYQFGNVYTTIRVGDQVVAHGNRDPLTRIPLVPYDWKGRTVLDLGCNCGGMLYAVQPWIAHGTGFEINTEAVANAKRVQQDHNITNLEFHVRDLENHQQFEIPHADITFMLSISRWVTTWREVLARVTSDHLLFEAHSRAKTREAEEQIEFVRTLYPNVQHLLTAKETKVRSLYYCTR
jgi:SAM-dependent methyltransferase